MPQGFISTYYNSPIKLSALNSSNWSLGILGKSPRGIIAKEVAGSTGQMTPTCGVTSGSDNPTRDRGVCIEKEQTSLYSLYEMFI
jgi:hypothetical protein